MFTQVCNGMETFAWSQHPQHEHPTQQQKTWSLPTLTYFFLHILTIAKLHGSCVYG